MALAGKIAAIELSQQVQDRFMNKYFEGRLLNAPGEVYTPGTTTDSTFLANEVPFDLGGYQRRIIYYTPSDVSNYTDGGVGLAQKATVFSHDGSANTIDFTHVALCWSDKNATDLDSVQTSDIPTPAVDGNYFGVPFDVTTGNGRQLTVNLIVINDGATAGDWSISIARPGYNVAVGDEFTINATTLVAAGVTESLEAGALVFRVTAVFDAGDKAGQLVAVAKTSNTVTLTSGNEAAFYWNLKQYGFYESLLAI